MSARATSRSGWRDNPIARVVAYYAVLLSGLGLLWYLVPAARSLFFVDAVTGDFPGESGRSDILSEVSRRPMGAPWESDAALTAGAAVIMAALLALPVAWIYILTRKKKGYRQSVVHTLVLLPVVVAGVVVLVKNSIALAFSLAGIVAAVRFRNTLDDSKDAVYIFLVTGLGLAAGVQPSVAVVSSILFNVLVLWLWYSDFGRSPAAFEGSRAERQLERAMAIVNRTGSFVARVDDELLKSMSPEQLEALADRAWRRRKRGAPEVDDGEEPAHDTLLRIRTTDIEAAKRVVRPVITEHATRWRFGGVVHTNDGMHILEYGLELPEGTNSHALRDALHRRGAPHVLDVEVH